MRALRGLPQLALAHVRETVRSRVAAFWTLVFPVAWVLLAGAVFGRGERSQVTLLMPGVFTVILITGSFFSVTFRMVAERQAGIMRRYRATPVTALTVVLSHAVNSLVMLSISLLLQVITGWLVFHAEPRGSLGALAVVLLAAELAFVPLGLLVGSMARDQRSAPALTHAIFFPMMFLSGAAVQFHRMPEWLQAIGRVLPATWTMEALHRVVVRGEGLADITGPLAILLVTCVVGATVNALVFRWESTEPVRWPRVGLALLALAIVYGGVALLGPELSMQHVPAEFSADAASPLP